MSKDDITIVGKAPPEPPELERANDRGFDDVELYLERSHLADVIFATPGTPSRRTWSHRHSE